MNYSNLKNRLIEEKKEWSLAICGVTIAYLFYYLIFCQ
jgi:hypothetical protein